jgi:hypothetical protein
MTSSPTTERADGRVDGRHRAAAEHGLDSQYQFPRGERFGQIVVSTELQAADAVRFARLRSQHHDRQATCELRGDRLAGDVGQVQVEHEQIDPTAFEDRHGLSA